MDEDGSVLRIMFERGREEDRVVRSKAFTPSVTTNDRWTLEVILIAIVQVRH